MAQWIVLLAVLLSSSFWVAAPVRAQGSDGDGTGSAFWAQSRRPALGADLAQAADSDPSAAPDLQSAPDLKPSVPLSSPEIKIETDGAVEEVVVTGSRIVRDPNLGSISPVEGVSAEQLEFSGEPDIAEVLNDIPALLTSATQQDAGGASILQLRALGAERTLTLVNGRRHVGGVAGSASVDIGSIPSLLIERVDVLTGGASSVYGADAVTGVVNFILKDNFEGFRGELNAGAAAQGGAGTLDGGAVYGFNFAESRGNLAFAVDVAHRDNLEAGDRHFSRDNRPVSDLPNPALLFQRGDIDASNTPNFFRFFSTGQGRFPTGSAIPDAMGFSDAFMKAFGNAPALTAEEQKLIRRAMRAPSRSLRRGGTFSISSNGGVIAPKDFMSRGTDLNGNGIDDCQESFVGFNSRQMTGGCFVVGRDGKVRPFRDGTIAGPTNQFGGDGSPNGLDQNFLTPKDDRYSLNLLGHFDFTDFVTAFGEAKYAYSKTDAGGPGNTFADLLTIAPDNPFIPDSLKPLAQQAGGLFITRDPADLGGNIDTAERETYRFVGGLKGNLPNGWNWETSANFGKFQLTGRDRNSVLQDRFFAAIDVTTGPDGKPICRSELMPTAPPTTPFDIPLFDSGFFSFRPGEGKCKPANLLGGRNSISNSAVGFITTTTINRSELTQQVFNATLSGDTEGLLPVLPGGAPKFSLGVEHRDEESQSNFDPLVRGLLPVDGPAGKKGTPVSKIMGVRQGSLVFDPASKIRNSGGQFRVNEAFAEISLPVLLDAKYTKEFTLDGAARISRYSTIGSTFTYSAGASWAPMSDIRFRTTMAEAVRAPNIDELFSPEQGAFFRPDDPCAQAAIDALKASDARGAIREKNCRAAGIPEGFEDPLTARFSGVTSGNRSLKEETARTFTAGVVLTPRFLDGVNVSVDFFKIDIDDAISAVGSQDIVNGCFDSASFPNNQNCMLFTRNTDPNSPQFRGFNFLRQTELNFAALQTRGFDFGLKYDFSWRSNDFSMSVSGTHVTRLDSFFDPLNSGAKNPGLGEIRRPEWAGNFNFGWIRGPLGVRWQTQYQDEQTLGGVEIETVQATFGKAGTTGETFVHDLSLSYNFNEDRYQVFGGVNNVTNEMPFVTEAAFPVNPVGRAFFLGVRVNY